VKSALAQETYISESKESIAKMHDFLAAHAVIGNEPPVPQFFISGSRPNDQVEIPEQIYEVLLQVVAAMEQGMAVTVSPQSMTLTTQQAAEVLNISRPTLIRLLDSGEIAHEKPSRHRRIKLQDVLAYREAQRQKQYAALDAMAYDDEATLADNIEDLRAAKKATGVARRSARSS
jgi:excisionase family DNA binding protein